MSQNEQKRAAAHAALDYIVAGEIIGVGTGSTANYFIDALAAAAIPLAGAVSSSVASAQRLQRHGIPVVELSAATSLSVYVDGADECTRDRHLIKGGGGALTREKIVAASARRFVCIVDNSKTVARLGSFPLPLEVIQFGAEFIRREMIQMGGEPRRRENFTTDNGHDIIDVHGLQIDDPQLMETALNQLPGMICNGLFALRPPDVVLVGHDHGIEVIQ